MKAKLLDAIISTGVAYINGPRLPSEPEDVILGVPIDSNDPSQGWMDLEIPELDDGGGKKAKKPSVLNATPFGAGLSDGMALAFRFRRKGDGDDGMDTDENQWDVVLPAYDDEADSQANDGEENGQDAS